MAAPIALLSKHSLAVSLSAELVLVNKILGSFNNHRRVRNIPRCFQIDDLIGSSGFKFK